LIQNYVKDIVLDEEGNLIVATYKGLSIYNKQTDNFLQIASAPSSPDHLNSNFINCLCIKPGKRRD
jgi:ligand-binding sensor domain-containing protein